MTFEEFQSSLNQNVPPAGCSDYLKSLWHDGRGDWDASHNIAQDIPTKEGDWIHAYLHRKEGDQWNAGYWYRRAGRPMPDYSLEKEWEEMARYFL
ncbi:MAG: hypothetical protein AAFZ15_01030 [Bacteroidota bacterium]